MKLLVATAFALAATFSSLSADSGCGGCKKKGDGCKKDETTLNIDFQNDGCNGGGCKKKGGGCKKDETTLNIDFQNDGCNGGGCKKKGDGCKKEA